MIRNFKIKRANSFFSAQRPGQIKQDASDLIPKIENDFADVSHHDLLFTDPRGRKAIRDAENSERLTVMREWMRRDLMARNR